MQNITISQGKGGHEMTIIKKEYKDKCIKISINGRRKTDCNDYMAKKLRILSLSEIENYIVTIISPHYNINIAKYVKLNNGLKRMVYGNIIRNYMKFIGVKRMPKK